MRVESWTANEEGIWKRDDTRSFSSGDIDTLEIEIEIPCRWFFDSNKLAWEVGDLYVLGDGVGRWEIMESV